MQNTFFITQQANDEMIQCVVCEDWFHSRVRYNMSLMDF